jgi:hypothetical protein
MNKYYFYKNKYLYFKKTYICDIESYIQHEGECWNDSIQIIFTYSKLLTGIQDKIMELEANPELNLIKLTDRIINNAFDNRRNFIPINLNNEEDEKKFKSSYSSYIFNFLKRYKNIRESKTTKIEAKKGITCAIKGLNFSNIGKSFIQNSDANHGATQSNSSLNMLSLGFFLLEGDQFINFDIYNLENTHYSFLTTQLETQITKYFAMLITIKQHDICVYKCTNEKEYFYDDNNKIIIEFNWINYFEKNVFYNDYEFYDGKKIKTRKHLLLESNKDDWEYYHFGTREIDQKQEYRSTLCYYNEKIDKILVVINSNEFIMINNSSTYSLSPILSIRALYIDTADSRESYIRNLEKFNLKLYSDFYNIPIINEFVYRFVNSLIVSDSSSEKTKNTLQILVQNALNINHSEVLDLVLTNFPSYFLEDKYYLYLLEFFYDIEQFNFFLNKTQLVPDYNFLTNIIIYNNKNNLKLDIYNRYIKTNNQYNRKFINGLGRDDNYYHSNFKLMTEQIYKYSDIDYSSYINFIKYLLENNYLGNTFLTYIKIIDVVYEIILFMSKDEDKYIQEDMFAYLFEIIFINIMDKNIKKLIDLYIQILNKERASGNDSFINDFSYFLEDKYESIISHNKKLESVYYIINHLTADKKENLKKLLQTKPNLVSFVK